MFYNKRIPNARIMDAIKFRIANKLLNFCKHDLLQPYSISLRL